MKKQFFTTLLFLLMLTVSAVAQDQNQLDSKGKKHGPWAENYPEMEVLRYSGNFIHGVPTGEFIYNFPSGELKAKNTFGDGGKRSDALLYHKDGGRLKAEGTYINQVKSGVWKFYHISGYLASEETYVKGKKHGVAYTYFENQKHAEIIHYNMDIKHGEWKTYYENGRVREEAGYVDGNVDGTFTKYYKNGKPLVTGTYKNAVKNGAWKFYQENGNLDYQELYKNGVVIKDKKENGSVKMTYDDGRPKAEYNYQGGQKHGKFKEWNDDGEWKEEMRPRTETTGQDEYYKFVEGQTLKRTGNYTKGKLHGRVINYNEFGIKINVETYEHGELVSTE